MHESIQALRDAGCEIRWVPRVNHTTHFVYVTSPGLPGIVILSKADFPLLGQLPTLSVPIVPSREYGSAVMVDHNETMVSLVNAVMAALCSTEIRPRFSRDAPIVPVDRREMTAELITQVVS